MKAVVLHETGGPDKLRIEDVPTPSPAPGQVRVALNGLAVKQVCVPVSVLPGACADANEQIVGIRHLTAELDRAGAEKVTLA
jgi:hypothetical protein